jgi:hypothetical protein
MQRCRHEGDESSDTDMRRGAGGKQTAGLQRVKEAAWGMTVNRFEEVCAAAGFIAH